MLALDYHNQFGHRLDQRILEQDERLNRGSFDHSQGAAAQRGSDGSHQAQNSLFPPTGEREDFNDDDDVPERRINLGLSELLSATNHRPSAYNPAIHSVQNSVHGGIRSGMELGLSLGVDVGSFSYQNRTGTTQQENIMSSLRDNAPNAGSVTAANIRTSGASPTHPIERRIGVRRNQQRGERDQENHLSEEANMMSRLLHKAEEEEYEYDEDEEDDEEYESHVEEDEEVEED